MRLEIKRTLAVLILSCVMIQPSSSKSAPKNDLKDIFKGIIMKFCKDPGRADSLWTEVENNYTGGDRHYHNLDHLDNFYNQLLKCRAETGDWETLVLAMVYHDVIYNSPDHKDEERSAELAVERLRSAKVPDDKIEKCRGLILATKAHALSADKDTNLFNDGDMSILGLDRNIYKEYVKNVRLEYGSSPQFDAGRKKVLKYFLGMDRIFKTEVFHNLYENAARANIQWELDSLPE